MKSWDTKQDGGHEQLILVDEQDREIGQLDKERCHDGAGLLHRAFSVFLFDGQGRLLVQQRAAGKRLWPGFWANSCCSHPRFNESLELAAKRRVQEELGMAIHQVQPIDAFVYQAHFGDLGSEHEYCHILFAQTTDSPHINQTEIAQIEWLHADQVRRSLRENQERWTPWFKLEMALLEEKHPSLLERYGFLIPAA